MKKQKTILVAPLNWGLGHATRCIPIIGALIEHGYGVLLASDGPALSILQKEFPELPFITLPSYDITYPKKGEFFKFKMFLKLPQIQRAISAERKMIKKLIREEKIQGIISDNRMGIRSKKVPSVFITHQLNVLSGNTSFFSSKMHQKIIKKFDECWVPDVVHPVNLSGKLGHPKKLDFEVKYIGPLSRMEKRKVPITYDILALLSGPEPQRTLLEEKLMTTLSGIDKKVLLVRGVIEEKTRVQQKGNITLVNFMQSKELEQAINESRVVLSRSGYTTIMDLAAMEKEAFFIPTPGQYEQKYLAKQLREKGIVPSCKQEKFRLDKLEEIRVYKGLKEIKSTVNYTDLFGLFQGKGKF
ncbi:MAG: glycosyltransferase [Bacteroidota bacterium]